MLATNVDDDLPLVVLIFVVTLDSIFIISVYLSLKVHLLYLA